MGLPRKNARQRRLMYALITLLCGGLAVWLFTTGGDRLLASLLALAALFALLDTLLGWRKRQD